MTLAFPFPFRLAATAIASLPLMLCPSSLVAQTPPPAALHGPTVSPIRPGPEAPDGRSSGLWAAGADYKVSFHDGMTFYPRTGSSLPHQPVRWRTTSARAGELELLAPAHARSLTPRHGDLRCEYDLGAVVERYDVRSDGLEQSFVVAQRPPAGDLVITGELTTTLRLPPSPARHGALALSLPDGRELVGYGAATAIDATGRQTPVTTTTDGKHVVLRMAAEAVAAATFPLVVDPLFATHTLLALGSPMQEVDVLHETLTPPGQQANNWYAWTTEFAAGDHDLRLWRTSSDWTATITEQYREISNWDSRHGRLALAPAADRVVLVHSTDIGAHRYVVVHRHHVGDNFLVTSSIFVPQTSVSFSDWRPDVGGRLGSGGSEVLITFQREAVAPFANTDNSTIWATVFDASAPSLAAGFVVLPFVVLARPDADQERPTVNQASATDNWLVAFQELNNQVANDDWDIPTVAVDASGAAAVTTLETEHAGDPLLHKIDPELAGAFGRFVLTYTTRVFELPNPKPTNDVGSEVHAQRLNWDFATATGSLPFAAVTLLAIANNGLVNGGSAFDPTSRSHWCTGVRSLPGSRYRVWKLGYTGEVVEQATIQLPGTSTPAAFATTFAASPRQFPIVFADNTSTAAGLLYGTMLRYVSLAPPALVGVSCGSGLWTGLGATADRQQIGAQAMPLRLAGAPDDTFALLALSLAQANVPGSLIGLDGCTIVPDLAAPNFLGLLVTPIVAGQATLTLDLPPTLSPFTLVAQWGYFVDPPTNPLGIQLSEGLVLTIDR